MIALVLQAHLVLEIDTPSRLILYWKRLFIAKLVTLVYNVYISFGLGYCRLLIILVNLYQVLDDPNSN